MLQPLPLRSMLDPRSREEAVRAPLADSVNIPLDELSNRTYELPSRGDTVRVADVGALSQTTAELLQSLERKSIVVPARSGTLPQSGRLWSPNPFLEEIASRLAPGTALDLACGAGREAIYLASLGWTVLAADVLPDAIQRAALLASQYPEISRGIEWRVIDLERDFPDTPSLQLVTTFYFLSRLAIGRAIHRLAPAGSLVLETFTDRHRERFRKPRSESRVLRVGEAAALMDGLRLEHFSEDWRQNGRHTARIWARRLA